MVWIDNITVNILKSPFENGLTVFQFPFTKLDVTNINKVTRFCYFIKLGNIKLVEDFKIMEVIDEDRNRNKISGEYLLRQL